MPSARPARNLRLTVVSLVLVGVIAAACNSTKADPATDALARGVAAQNAGNPDDARRAYFETLAANPKNLAAFYNLGQIARVGNKPAIAEGYYRQALEIDPTHAPSLFGLAYVRAQQGGISDAIGLYRKVISIDPNHATAHYNLGLLLRLTDAVAEGDSEVAKGRQLDPSLPAPAPLTTAAPSATPSASPKR